MGNRTLAKAEIDRADMTGTNKKSLTLWDRDGLHLKVTKSPKKGSIRKVWQTRVTLAGKRLTVSIGIYPRVGLSEARQENQRIHVEAREGIDPRSHRGRSRAPVLMIPAQTGAMQSMIFADAVDDYVSEKTKEFRNDKHKQQWRNTLATYAVPVIGAKLVDQITTNDVLAVLKPIWHDKTETASRLRGRIEKVLDWANVGRAHDGKNPARWKGNLEHMLPSPKKIKATSNRPAMHHDELPEFLAGVVDNGNPAGLALAFLILTGTRSGEVRGARWDEIEDDVWTIPAERMKMNKPHRVPLTPHARDVLEKLRGVHPDIIFANPTTRKKLSENALSSFIKKSMKRSDVTAHGMRSTFRTWAAEQGADERIAEMCLAHDIRGNVECAYNRTDYLERRRDLMEQWSTFAASRLPVPRRRRQIG